MRICAQNLAGTVPLLEGDSAWGYCFIEGCFESMAPIQICLKGNTLRDFLDKSICHIEDCTPLVRKWNEQRKKGNLNSKKLPLEKIYPVKDKAIRNRLAMK